MLRVWQHPRIFGVSAAVTIVALPSFLFRPGAFLGQDVTCECMMALNFSGRRNLEALGRAFMCFQFLVHRLSLYASFGANIAIKFGPSILGLASTAPTSDKLFHQPIQQRAADALVDDLASPEKYRCFDLVALFQESDDVILFELVIVLIRIGTKLHFLDRDVLLMLLRFVKLLVQLVEVLAVIHDPANRRGCSWRYLHQIQSALLSDLQRLPEAA